MSEPPWFVMLERDGVIPVERKSHHVPVVFRRFHDIVHHEANANIVQLALGGFSIGHNSSFYPGRSSLVITLYRTGKQSRSFANAIGPEYRFLISVCV